MWDQDFGPKWHIAVNPNTVSISLVIFKVLQSSVCCFFEFPIMWESSHIIAQFSSSFLPIRCLVWKVKVSSHIIETNCTKIKLGRKLYVPFTLLQLVQCLFFFFLFDKNSLKSRQAGRVVNKDYNRTKKPSGVVFSHLGDGLYTQN